MSITLGDKPDSMVVCLSKFGDFTAGLRRIDPTTGAPVDWPAGLDVVLRFYPDKEADHEVEWAADVTGPLISWYVPRADVEADVLGADPKLKVARLIYITSSPVRELEWFTGRPSDAH